MHLLHPQSWCAQALRGIPLRLVLVVPFVLQIFAAVGLTGWVSLRNGQKAVHALATELRTEVSLRVTNYLESQLQFPHSINQLNLHAINAGVLDLQNFEQLGQVFYQQMKIFDVGYINFANPQGEFIGVERLPNKAIVINETRRPFLSRMSIYQPDDQGNRLKLEKVIVDDPPIQEEGWYADAVKAQKPLWTSIYQWDDKPEVLSISASYPIYDRQKQLLGVIGVDLILSKFSLFLKKLKFSPSGEIFIIERDGLLVASSASELPFLVIAGEAQRMSAVQSSNPLIQATAQHLVGRFGKYTQIQTTHQLSFSLGGDRQFVQITPWKDAYGLDWLVVVVMPESDFMEQINANTRTTILLCLLALATAMLFGLVTSRWISQQIQHLIKVSQNIASGDLDQTSEIQIIRELEDLSQAFNQMAAQLKASFAELEARVAQRTVELAEAKNAAEAASRAKSEFLQAMSHELRTPLNAILGVVQVLQHDTSLFPEHQERLKITYRNGNHLLALINDLLEIAKIGTEQATAVSHRFDRELRLKSVARPLLPEKPIDQDLVAYLKQMPSEWIAQIHRAAVIGFDQDILELVNQIPIELAPLAVQLRVWVNDFQFDQVAHLIQQWQQEDAPGQL